MPTNREKREAKSLGHWQRKSCNGKQHHSDPVGALLACLMSHREHGDAHLWPYKCVFCPYWHVGHLPLAAREMIAFLLGVPPFVRGREVERRALHRAYKSAAEAPQTVC